MSLENSPGSDPGANLEAISNSGSVLTTPSVEASPAPSASETQPAPETPSAPITPREYDPNVPDWLRVTPSTNGNVPSPSPTPVQEPVPPTFDPNASTHEEVVDAAGNTHNLIADRALAEAAAYTQKPHWEEEKALREAGKTAQAADVAAIGRDAVAEVEATDEALSHHMKAAQIQGEREVKNVAVTANQEITQKSAELETAQAVATQAEALPTQAGLGMAAEQLRQESQAKVAGIQTEIEQKQAEALQKVADTRAENARKLTALREKHLDIAEAAGSQLGQQERSDYDRVNNIVANTLRVTLEHLHGNNPEAFVQPLPKGNEAQSTAIRTGIIQQLGVTPDSRSVASTVHEINGVPVVELISEAGDQIDPNHHLRIVETVNVQTGDVISISTIISPEPTTIERRRFGFFGRREVVINPDLATAVQTAIGQQPIMQDKAVIAPTPSPRFSDHWTMLRTRFQTDGFDAATAGAQMNRLRKQAGGFWFRLIFGGVPAKKLQQHQP